MAGRIGRPTKGADHVDNVEGSVEAKRRAKVILEVTSGSLAVKEGAARLGLSVARLEQLRAQALSGAVAFLEPRPIGRPRKASRDAEVERLEGELASLAWHLEAARVREEIALLWPHLVVKPGQGGPGKAKAPRRSRASSGARRGTGKRRKR